MGFWQIIVSAVLCGLVVVVVPSGAVWFVVFACLPCSQERKGSGVFFLTCFWASLERSGVMLISSKWGGGCNESHSALYSALLLELKASPSFQKGEHSLPYPHIPESPPLHWGLLCLLLIFSSILRWPQKQLYDAWLEPELRDTSLVLMPP